MKKLILLVLFMSVIALWGQEQYEYSFEYYKDKAKKAKRHRTRGISFTAVGAGFLGLATVAAIGMDSDQPEKGPLVGLLIAIGVVNVAIGIPLWVVGAKKYKKNHDAMKALEPSLSFGTTRHGVGFILKL